MRSPQCRNGPTEGKLRWNLGSVRVSCCNFGERDLGSAWPGTPRCRPHIVVWERRGLSQKKAFSCMAPVSVHACVSTPSGRCWYSRHTSLYRDALNRGAGVEHRPAPPLSVTIGAWSYRGWRRGQRWTTGGRPMLRRLAHHAALPLVGMVAFLCVTTMVGCTDRTAPPSNAPRATTR